MLEHEKAVAEIHESIGLLEKTSAWESLQSPVERTGKFAVCAYVATTPFRRENAEIEIGLNTEKHGCESL